RVCSSPECIHTHGCGTVSATPRRVDRPRRACPYCAVWASPGTRAARRVHTGLHQAQGERKARGDRAMSIVAPFLVLLLAGAFAAYHRMRLATWTAITAAGLAACWLLGANRAATVVAIV